MPRKPFPKSRGKWLLIAAALMVAITVALISLAVATASFRRDEITTTITRVGSLKEMRELSDERRSRGAASDVDSSAAAPVEEPEIPQR